MSGYFSLKREETAERKWEKRDKRAEKKRYKAVRWAMHASPLREEKTWPDERR